MVTFVSLGAVSRNCVPGIAGPFIAGQMFNLGSKRTSKLSGGSSTVTYGCSTSILCGTFSSSLHPVHLWSSALKALGCQARSTLPEGMGPIIPFGPTGSVLVGVLPRATTGVARVAGASVMMMSGAVCGNIDGLRVGLGCILPSNLKEVGSSLPPNAKEVGTVVSMGVSSRAATTVDAGLAFFSTITTRFFCTTIDGFAGCFISRLMITTGAGAALTSSVSVA